MLTVMVITDNIKNNEKIAASIIGGFENSACIIAATDISECEQIIRSQKNNIDIFIIQIKMREKSGRKLAEYIRCQGRAKIAIPGRVNLANPGRIKKAITKYSFFL